MSPPNRSPANTLSICLVSSDFYCLCLYFIYWALLLRILASGVAPPTMLRDPWPCNNRRHCIGIRIGEFIFSSQVRCKRVRDEVLGQYSGAVGHRVPHGA